MDNLHGRAGQIGRKNRWRFDPISIRMLGNVSGEARNRNQDPKGPIQ